MFDIIVFKMRCPVIYAADVVIAIGTCPDHCSHFSDAEIIVRLSKGRCFLIKGIQRINPRPFNPYQNSHLPSLQHERDSWAGR